MSKGIVVFGGSGVFGKRVVREILRLCEARVTIVARNRPRAEAVRESLASDRISLLFGDARSAAFAREAIRGAAAAVSCLGPFHTVDLTILEACIAERVHYVDAGTVRFFVGFESRLMNRLISIAGRARHAGLLPSGPRIADALVRLGGIFSFTGYDGGALQAAVTGKDRGGRTIRSTAAVMADREGQRIPAMPAALAACALERGEPIQPGVRLFAEWMDPRRYLSELESAGFRVERLSPPAS